MSEIDLSQAYPPADLPYEDLSGYFVAKRAIDIVLASLVILLLLPLFLIIAIAIKADSPGPVIFAQPRLGGRRVARGGSREWVVETFTMFKFRTMEVGADASLHRDYMTAYLTGDEDRLASLRPGRKANESFRPSADPRVTRVGGVLRKLSLDELPQLWNVLWGDMSLVGPRPPMAYEVEHYEGSAFRRLASRPGMTGWAQVRGRCSIDFEEMVRLDLEYLERRSSFLDLKILLLTIPIVLSRKGAD